MYTHIHVHLHECKHAPIHRHALTFMHHINTHIHTLPTHRHVLTFMHHITHTCTHTKTQTCTLTFMHHINTDISHTNTHTHTFCGFHSIHMIKFNISLVCKCGSYTHNRCQYMECCSSKHNKVQLCGMFAILICITKFNVKIVQGVFVVLIGGIISKYYLWDVVLIQR